MNMVIISVTSVYNKYFISPHMQHYFSASEATATWRFTNFVLYCIVLHNTNTQTITEDMVLTVNHEIEQ